MLAVAAVLMVAVEFERSTVIRFTRKISHIHPRKDPIFTLSKIQDADPAERLRRSLEDGDTEPRVSFAERRASYSNEGDIRTPGEWRAAGSSSSAEQTVAIGEVLPRGPYDEKSAGSPARREHCRLGGQASRESDSASGDVQGLRALISSSTDQDVVTRGGWSGDSCSGARSDAAAVWTPAHSVRAVCGGGGQERWGAGARSLRCTWVH